jgi:hypothetical protein
MPADLIRLELDCVSGEKIIFQRSETPGALVAVTVDGRTVQVKPAALLLVLLNLNLKSE